MTNIGYVQHVQKSISNAWTTILALTAGVPVCVVKSGYPDEKIYLGLHNNNWVAHSTSTGNHNVEVYYMTKYR